MLIVLDKYKKFFSAENSCSIGMQNLLKPIQLLNERGTLQGYHVLMTSPFTYENPHKPFEMSNAKLLTAELSARLWRQFNGSISLITDETGFDYIKKTALSKAYDEILPILDKRNFGIVPTKYWASGKIQALTKISAPCVVLDMDMLIWQKLPIDSAELICTHTEPLSLKCYPTPEFFHTDAEYSYPSDWDFTVEPLNTAILYNADNGVICMVFAEQRILAMCAEEKGIIPKTLLIYDKLSEPQSLLTHIWSAQKIIEMIPGINEIFNDLCKEKLSFLKFSESEKPKLNIS